MKRLGILPGAFNPVTRAHAALAQAALQAVDEIICVMPREFPHKELHGATLDQRLHMLRLLNLPAAITESGLFIDIARELRRPNSELFLICGADAAERVISWDYGESGAIDRILEEFSLLVASRKAPFHPPHRIAKHIHALDLPAGYEHVSSTEVRDRIAAGAPWEHLVPEAIVTLVKTIYSPFRAAKLR